MTAIMPRIALAGRPDVARLLVCGRRRCDRAGIAAVVAKLGALVM
jgi:hypothetical protein